MTDHKLSYKGWMNRHCTMGKCTRGGQPRKGTFQQLYFKNLVLSISYNVKQAEKLKSHKMKEGCMKNDEG